MADAEEDLGIVATVPVTVNIGDVYSLPLSTLQSPSVLSSGESEKVSWTTVDGSATVANDDYGAASGGPILLPSSTTIAVATFDSSSDDTEAGESFDLNLNFSGILTENIDGFSETVEVNATVQYVITLQQGPILTTTPPNLQPLTATWSGYLSQALQYGGQLNQSLSLPSAAKLVQGIFDVALLMYTAPEAGVLATLYEVYETAHLGQDILSAVGALNNLVNEQNPSGNPWYKLGLATAAFLPDNLKTAKMLVGDLSVANDLGEYSSKASSPLDAMAAQTAEQNAQAALNNAENGPLFQVAVSGPTPASGFLVPQQLNQYVIQLTSLNASNQVQGAEFLLLGQGVTGNVGAPQPNQNAMTASAAGNVNIPLTGQDVVGLFDNQQTVDVASGMTGSLTVDGSYTSDGTVVFNGNYGAFQTNYASAAATATTGAFETALVENASMTVLVENVSTIVFNDYTVTFDSNGNPLITLNSGVSPSIGTLYDVTSSQAVISGFNQDPYFDPLHGDKIYLAAAEVAPNAGNFIAAPDIVTNYQDAVTLANSLLQQYRYVAIAYDQGTSDAGSTTVQPTAGQDFLLLFVDTVGNHQADAIIRLVGLDNVSEISTSDLVVPLAASSDTGAQIVSSGHVVTVTLNLSAPATVTETPTLQLNDNEVAYYTGGSGTNTLSFVYMVQPADNVADLQVTGLNLPSGASISSLSGTVTGDLGLSIAGKLAPATVAQEINGLYLTLYGIAATAPGIAYWENTLSSFDPGATPGSAISVNDETYLGQQMTAGSPIVNGTTYFATLYPTSMSDMAFVQALYQNMSNFIGTVAGDNYWFNLLQQAEAANGGNVIAARESLAGQFVHDFLSNDLTVGAAALNVSQSDYTLLVNGQQALLNRAAVSQYYANETAQPGGSILNFTSVTSPAFTAAHEVLTAVTSDPSTVAIAIAGINNAVAQQDLSLI